MLKAVSFHQWERHRRPINELQNKQLVLKREKLTTNISRLPSREESDSGDDNM
jgi:hypothetical protein